MELMIECRFCGCQETVYIAGNYAAIDCQGCGETMEIETGETLEQLENETQLETVTV